LDIHNILSGISDKPTLARTNTSAQENKSENSNVISDSLSDTLPAFMPRPESPQEYVNRIMQEQGFTHRKVAERAKALGHKLSGGYVHNIASGDIDNPTVKLIKALAAGLGRPDDEVFAKFRGQTPTESGEYKESLFAALWAEYQNLPAKEQRELRTAIDMLQREIQRRTQG
jgi:transcriptional regulator with XRE-family HTH domain